VVLACEEYDQPERGPLDQELYLMQYRGWEQEREWGEERGQDQCGEGDGSVSAIVSPCCPT